MYDTTDYNMLIEKVNQLMVQPESISHEELQQLMKSPLFVSLYQSALDAKRVIAEETSVPDVDEAYQDFINDISETDIQDLKTIKRSINISKYILIAAACVAALVIFSFRHTLFGGSTSSERNDLITEKEQLYIAEDGQNDILISSGKKTINLTTLADNQHIAESLGITIQGDEIRCDALNLDDYKISSNTIILPQGKVAKIVLPDGSRVWLNARSSLIYPNKFVEGAPRMVRLNGEAYFEVTPNKNCPFIVETEKMNTRVLGTSFNIRSYNGESPIVTLVSGSVKVSSSLHSFKNSQAILKPGQQWLLEAGNWKINDVDTKVYTCWRDELFYFDGQTLREIMVEIGRWYNMTVLLDNNVHINDRLHFNGERGWTIQELVDQMNMVCKTKIRIEGDTLKVY